MAGSNPLKDRGIGLALACDHRSRYTPDADAYTLRDRGCHLFDRENITGSRPIGQTNETSRSRVSSRSMAGSNPLTDRESRSVSDSSKRSRYSPDADAYAPLPGLLAHCSSKHNGKPADRPNKRGVTRLGDPSFVWCRWPDSNRHSSRYCPLKTACLPIPPHRQILFDPRLLVGRVARRLGVRVGLRRQVWQLSGGLFASLDRLVDHVRQRIVNRRHVIDGFRSFL